MMTFKVTILTTLAMVVAGRTFFTDTVPTSGSGALDIIPQKCTWQGRERTYWLHLPPEDKMAGPLPVLFNLHGGGGTGKGAVRLTYGRFNQLADREGFIVVYPDAVARNWNDGRTAHLKPENKDVDDVGFIAEITKRLQESHPIDPDRIFTVGMSNGGFMSSRLLCDRADLFRGGAIVTATLAAEYVDRCDPDKPVAILVMNGTDDPLVPYGGGHIRLLWNGASRGEVISTDDFIELWKEKNGCAGQKTAIDLPDRKKWDGTTVHVTTYTNCRSGGALKMYRIEGGGHTWPGGRQYLGKALIGNTSREMNACYEIWDFFASLE
jgi:polyhydroxybutyrate depolymerase